MVRPWQGRTPAEQEAADKTVEFIRHLSHTKGKWAGVPFDPLPWQEHELIRPLFGTLNPDGARQYRTAFVEVARKSGKSELGAAIALKMLFADGEAGGEVYGAAADRDQASIVFHVAAQMVRQQPALAKRAKIIDSSKRIIVTTGKSAGSVYRAIPADAAGSHGFNASAVIFDEVHTQPNRELWDVLQTSTGARQQPLMLGITTAGYDRNSLCWQLHERAMGLLKLRDPERYAWCELPTAVEDDPTFFGLVYGAPDTADWQDPEVWKAANPSFGITVPESYFEQQVREAKSTPAYTNTFKRLHLNIWTGSASRWLDMEAWDRSGGRPDLEELKGAVAYGGLDLASTTDLAAFVLVFPDHPDPGDYTVLPTFWIPQDNMDEKVRKDRVPYDLWAAQGHVVATPGNVIDYHYIRRAIEGLRLRYDIREIAFDRWGAIQMSQELTEAGLELIPMGQGFTSMSPPTKEVNRLVLDGRLKHGGNPVLRWMADNTMVEQDAAGNIKPSKKKSTQRIDGVVALIMALDRATRNGAVSVYETRGITFI